MLLQTPTPTPTPITQIIYDPFGLILVSGLFLLLGYLFWLMLKYSHRLDQTSYVANLYTAALSSVERLRLSSPVEEAWEKKRYHEATVQDSQWLEKNKPPQTEDADVRSDYRVRYALQSLLESGWVGSLPPGLGSSGSPEKEEKVRLYLGELAGWQRSILHVEARRRYKEELQTKQKQADKMASQALGSIDLALLRGQGPHFVLQFTAVVVIIFATVALAILDRLNPEQAGTILAAIAGYVLGQAAYRVSQQTAESAKVSQQTAEGGKGLTEPGKEEKNQ